MSADELVFVALGGLGEIGMNAALYGFGPRQRRKWLLVDCGLGFAGPDLPGIDLVYPDLSFVESVRRDLVGLVITHAHEDHIGAIAALWPRLECPVFATRFAASLLETRRLSEPGAPDVPLRIVGQGERRAIGPFDVEFVPVAHSIPESCALAIRTSAGTVVHTGDWKIDPAPGVGPPTDEARLRAIGDEGVRALVCDSTNILREGESPSEADVARTLAALVADAPARVVVTLFASNVARVRAVALAAKAAGRQCVVLGRALDRSIAVARECGYLDDVDAFLPVERFKALSRDKIVLLATGSQGEPRAAMARLAEGEHPAVKLASGDRIIFSSRTIPGNEREVGRVINGLVTQGFDVITDRTALVHCSGHPRRDEVETLYRWLRPQVLVPAHGEALHLAEHARFARARGIPEVVGARNGDMVLLGPGQAGIVDEIATGRLLQDGTTIVGAQDAAVRERAKLAFAGVVSIALAVDSKGELAGDPDVILFGVPPRGANQAAMDATVDKAIFSTFESLPRARRRDADTVSTAIERAVRNAISAIWGKKPQVHVLIVEV
jgi:ribonuclease J